MVPFIVASELKMTLRELRARMDGTEMLEWMAFFRVRASPGPAQTDEEIAAAALARIATKKNAKR